MRRAPVVARGRVDGGGGAECSRPPGPLLRTARARGAAAAAAAKGRWDRWRRRKSGEAPWQGKQRSRDHGSYLGLIGGWTLEWIASTEEIMMGAFPCFFPVYSQF